MAKFGQTFGIRNLKDESPPLFVKRKVSREREAQIIAQAHFEDLRAYSASCWSRTRKNFPLIVKTLNLRKDSQQRIFFRQSVRIVFRRKQHYM